MIDMDILLPLAIKFPALSADKSSKETFLHGDPFSPGRVTAMTTREAIQMLMQSPFYFRMKLAARKDLIKEFRAIHSIK